MSRKLEEYLIKERNRLDTDSPDEEAIWEKIEREMLTQKRKPALRVTGTRWIRIRNIAATVIILFSLGYITKDIIYTISAGKQITLSSIDSNLGIREEQYKTQVNYRIHEVKAMPVRDEAIISELYNELSRLDTIYRQSMNDLKVLGPSDRIINTIFDTYEQRIKLLELIILEKNKIANHENNENINL